MSGIISMALKIHKKNGELTKEDYVDICRHYRHGSDPEKYWYKVKFEVETYLKDVEV